MHYVHVNIAKKEHEMTIRLMDASTYPSNSNVSLRMVQERLDKKPFWEQCGYSLSYVPPPLPPESTEELGAALIMAMANDNTDTLEAISEEHMQNIHGTDIVEVSRTVGDEVFKVTVKDTHV
jgi:hypothetical protein